MTGNEELSNDVSIDNPYLSNIVAIVLILVIGGLIIFYSIKIGESILSLIISVFIASISLFIALDANLNTKRTARSDLLGVIRNLFNSRFTFFRNLHNLEMKENIKNNQKLSELAKQYMEFATWDSVLCLKQAKSLKKWADKEDKNRLANSLKILIKNVLKQKNQKILKNRHVEHLLISCEHLEDIGISEKNKSEIINEFESYSITRKQCSECFQSYIRRKKKQVKTDPTGNLKSQTYLDELFDGFE